MARNFARGAPPPENSYEWAGVADPKAAGATAPHKITISAGDLVKSGTIPTGPLLFGSGLLLGFLLGRPR